MMKGKNRLGQG